MADTIETPQLTRDQIEYLRGVVNGTYDGSAICEDCGAPMRFHRLGGPAPYHPQPIKQPIYDPACYELAEHFLRDSTNARVQYLKHQLATAIQRTVETFIEYEENLDA